MIAFARRHPLPCFVALAYLWSWGFALPLLLHRRGWSGREASEALEAVAAFGPLVAALAMLALQEGRGAAAALLRGLGHWRVGARGWLLAAGTPFALLLVAVLLVGAGSGRWPAADSLAGGRLGDLAGWVQLIVVAGLVQGLGEEPGWRGWLLPRLRARRTALAATAVLFPPWLLWHLPAFLGRPEFGPPQFVAFAAGIFAAAVWLTFIMERTGSVLMAVAWHALINITRGVALALSTPHFLAMSTLVLAGALVIVALWVFPRRAATGVTPRRT